MKILIVSDNISMKMGGEASLAFYYFKLFRKRGLDVYCLCHERVEAEISSSFSKHDYSRFTFVKDTVWQAAIFKLSKKLPPRINFILGQTIYFSTMRRARLIVRQIILARGIQLVFEPSPITPKGLSFMYNLGIPVVIGPLCGGLEFPPAFTHMDSGSTRIIFPLFRLLSPFLHSVVPGKLNADALIVANKRTENALPASTKGKIYYVVESGVDLNIWKPRQILRHNENVPIRFVYSGRFVDWKGVEYLVEAFLKIADNTPAILELIGSGETKSSIEAQVRKAGLEARVHFHGWLSREESSKIIGESDVFIMPSLRECGGTAILEAMAIGLPVIATNWCGPAQYVTPECGILVDPRSDKDFVLGLAEAMSTLAHSPDVRRKMGLAGQHRVKTEFFDWDSKAGRIIEIFEEFVTYT